MRTMLVGFMLLLSVIHARPAAAAYAHAQRIPAAEITALARSAIAQMPHGATIAYLPVSSLSDQFVDRGRVSLHLQSPLVTAAYVNVPIAIDLNGHFLRTVFVGYRIQHYVMAATAAHDLAPGTVLSASDLKMALVPSTGLPLNGTKVLVGRQIIAPVRAGQPIAIEQTLVNEIVRAGMSCVLVIRDRGVSLVADVIARSSGGLGDQVSLYNPQTNKLLSGTVVGPDRVELNLSGGDGR